VTGDGPIGCPCSPVGECESVAKAVEKSLGWRIEGHWGDVGGWKNPGIQRVIPDILSSIDRGMPVIVIDKHLDSAVIYGYTDDEDFLVHAYYGDSVRCSTSELGQTPAGVMFVKRQMDPPPFSEVFRGVLEEVENSWYKERVDDDSPPFRGQMNGRAALEAWINFLTNFDELSDPDEPSRQPAMLLANHVWAYQHLQIARRKAEEYLLAKADFMGPGKRDLVKAGGMYREEADLLGGMVEPDREISLKNFPGLCQAYFSGAWTGMSKSWTEKDREKVRDTMQQSLEIENSAISLIRSALKT